MRKHQENSIHTSKIKFEEQGCVLLKMTVKPESKVHFTEGIPVMVGSFLLI